MASNQPYSWTRSRAQSPPPPPPASLNGPPPSFSTSYADERHPHQHHHWSHPPRASLPQPSYQHRELPRSGWEEERGGGWPDKERGEVESGWGKGDGRPYEPQNPSWGGAGGGGERGDMPPPPSTRLPGEIAPSYVREEERDAGRGWETSSRDPSSIHHAQPSNTASSRLPTPPFSPQINTSEYTPSLPGCSSFVSPRTATSEATSPSLAPSASPFASLNSLLSRCYDPRRPQWMDQTSGKRRREEEHEVGEQEGRRRGGGEVRLSGSYNHHAESNYEPSSSSSYPHPSGTGRRNSEGGQPVAGEAWEEFRRRKHDQQALWGGAVPQETYGGVRSDTVEFYASDLGSRGTREGRGTEDGMGEETRRGLSSQPYPDLARPRPQLFQPNASSAPSTSSIPTSKPSQYLASLSSRTNAQPSTPASFFSSRVSAFDGTLQYQATGDISSTAELRILRIPNQNYSTSIPYSTFFPTKTFSFVGVIPQAQSRMFLEESARSTLRKLFVFEVELGGDKGVALEALKRSLNGRRDGILMSEDPSKEVKSKVYLLMLDPHEDLPSCFGLGPFLKSRGPRSEVLLLGFFSKEEEEEKGKEDDGAAGLPKESQRADRLFAPEKTPASYTRPPSTFTAPTANSSTSLKGPAEALWASSQANSSILPRTRPVPTAQSAKPSTSTAIASTALPPRPVLAGGNMFQTLPKRPNPFARDPPKM